MKIKKNMKWHLFVRILILLVFSTWLTPTALAEEAIRVDQSSSLTIVYTQDTPLQNVKFSLYRIADISETGKFSWAESFQSYANSVSLNQEDQSGWGGVAEVLSAYAARDNISPNMTGATDQNGKLTINQMKTGLYLIVGSITSLDKTTYIPEASLVSVPNRDGGSTWTYDVTVFPKFNSVPETENTVTRKVLKVWKYDPGSEIRPQKVTVQLLCDGKVFDTVDLNAANNWSYQWSELKQGCSWQIVELDVPDHYLVTVNREGITYVVTNTFSQNVPSPENPPRTLLGPKLPQTGQLWWPVPILILLGINVLLLGLTQHRRRGKNE